MAIPKPQVLVSQQLTADPVGLVQPMRACIVGPLAKLHRFSVDDEKVDIDVGAYDRLLDAEYTWPERTAGSVVDVNSVKLFVADALLLYFEDLLTDVGSGKGTVAPVSGYKNRVRSSTVNFKTNGDYARSSLLFDRDVQIGDRVYLRGVADSDDDCDEVELWTYVAGFDDDTAESIVADATADVGNQESINEASASISQTAGATNCVIAAVDGSAFSGLADGVVSDTYTIEVVRSSVSGCNAARLRITSASGTDDADEVEPSDFGEPTEIGARGLEVTFSIDTGDCEDSASSAGVSAEEFVVGQKWVVEVEQVFEKVCATSGGDYDGDVNDTYIVEVTKGGTWAELPEITVTTVKGLDFSGPTTITDDNTDFPIGTHDVTIRFNDCFGADPASAASESESQGGDSAVAGLCLGDKFYVQVTSGDSGPMRTLILKHDIPLAIREVSDFDLRLFMVRDVEVTINRLNSPPDVNYAIESTQMVVKAGMTAYESTWTDDGVEQPLAIFGGTLYIEYREWLASNATDLNFVAAFADIEAIPGQLDVLNPVKWGVFRAFQNSNGIEVGWISVPNPTLLASWTASIGKLAGRAEIYNIIPMSADLEVLSLVQGHANAESSPENGNWKAMFGQLTLTTGRMIVGQSSASVQSLTPTSTDGELVLATIDDNPDATGTQYTRLSVPDANANFITYGVRAGDVVRFLFTIDAFGASTYSEFVVDSVLSENTLLLLAGHTSAISVAQKMEIWRTLTADEVVDDLVEKATNFGDRRVCLILPDIAGTGAIAQPGFYVAAALGGLASAVLPHQPLTNATVRGFDDFASRTRKLFTETQLGRLESAGIWICTQARGGSPTIRHALTTDISSLAAREESMRRNLDAISYLFLRQLRGLIGRANVSAALLLRMEYEVRQILKYLKTTIVSPDVGPQLIDGNIAVDALGRPLFNVDPLAADTVIIVLDLVLPAPLNYVRLTLVV